MTNSTIQAVQSAADQHLETALKGWAWSIAQAAKTPVAALKDFFVGTGWRDLENADQATHRVSNFNDKLTGCNACIAPEDIAAGDTDEQIESAIEHFEQLAWECETYAADLRAILQRRF
jgi:hypothetical protein